MAAAPSLDRNSALARGAALAVTVLVLIVCQVYVGYVQVFDAWAFLIGVGLPLSVGSILVAFTGQRALLLAYLGLFWSVVEDGPVYLDSIFTWPEVTRFHPALPHYSLEVLFHLLTLVLVLLSIREVVAGARPPSEKALSAYLLGFAAFVLAYAQNIPLDSIQSVVEGSWYQLDIVEHLASVLVFSVALLLAGYRFGSAPCPERRREGESSSHVSAAPLSGVSLSQSHSGRPYDYFLPTPR